MTGWAGVHATQDSKSESLTAGTKTQVFDLFWALDGSLSWSFVQVKVNSGLEHWQVKMISSPISALTLSGLIEIGSP